MAKEEQIIIAVKRDILFREHYFSGFEAAGTHDFESIIRADYTELKRGIAEQDPSYKQPIAYCIMYNPEKRRIFAFQRAAEKEDYDEKRLRGKWSFGVGGHVEPHDSRGGDPLAASMRRELEEEVAFDGTFSASVLGYINDDETEVGRVHFGILYLVEVTAAELSPRSSELADGRLRPLPEIDKICATKDAEIESWSKIAWEALKLKWGYEPTAPTM